MQFGLFDSPAGAADSAIAELIARGALFVINHSGGKDSQAMYLHVRKLVPADQIAIVHADLEEVEWAGAKEHIRATTNGERFVVCRNNNKTFLQMVDARGMFPSPQLRQCTSDLKRGPIERTIRHITVERKAMGLANWGLIVNCMGMRAEESSNRAKLDVFKFNAGNSKAGREWYDWLPIHGWSKDHVFAEIAAAGQKPHPVYELGMSRFSCVFCVMACEADLKTAARLAKERPELLNNPNLYRDIVAREKSTGQVMMMPKNGVKRTLEEITGIKAEVAHA